MANLIATIAARTALGRQAGSHQAGSSAGTHAATASPGPLTLAIDIGGSHIKVGLLDPAGAMIVGPKRVETPHPSTPANTVAAITGLVAGMGAFDRVSIGFPGVVRRGLVLTAPNLGTPAWASYDLAGVVSAHFGKPVRLLNDASVQGYGVICGTGLECVITLGTGMGFSMFRDGALGPHFEMGQHMCRKGLSYDHYVGGAALEEVGDKRWNRRVEKVIEALDTLVNFESLLIGGGNAKKIRFQLPPRVRIVPNEAGITGGVRLWDDKRDPSTM